jgi:hypothetical protein
MDRKTETSRRRNPGTHVIRLDGFTGKDGWRFIIGKGGWPVGPVGRLTVRGLYNGEWKTLRGPVSVSGGGVNKEGNPSIECWIAGTWPGVYVNGERVPQVAEDIEAVFEADTAVNASMDVEAITLTQFRTRT